MMGLDIIELVMEIEEEFGITIPDSDYAEIRTVGDLVDYCLNRIRATKTERCPTLPCFFSLRRLVREIRNDPELRIRPRESVETVLAKSERKRLWQRLPELLNSNPPELRRPPWLRRILVLLVLSFPLFLLAVLPWLAEIVILMLFATFAFALLLHSLTLGLRHRTPDGYTTFGDITKRMVGLTVATNPPAKTDFESVFFIVKRILIKTLGLDEDEVVPTARFIEDLDVT